MFRQERDRPLPAFTLPNIEGFPMGGPMTACPLPPGLITADPRREPVARKVPPHPNPFDPDEFRRDTPREECEQPPVVLQAEPKKGLGFDAAKCIVMVPVATHIEMDCDHSLRGLEALGFRVDRLKGASAIDMTRCIQATHAMDEGFEQLLFIDSDMMFDPQDAIKLFRSDEPVIAGVYVAKKLSKGGKGGQVNVDYEDEVGSVRYGDWPRDQTIYPAKGLAGGFLRIRIDALRQIVERLSLPLCQMGKAKAYPFFMPFYAREGDEELPRYFCEDYAFTRRCREAGIRPKADTSIRLYHLGIYPYGWEEGRGDYIPRERRLEAPARAK